MQLTDVILVSDLDGTIIPHSGIISKTNLVAIDKFKSLGGTFAIATGRSPLHAKYLCDQLNVTGLIICNNGACIYDVANDKNVWSKNLNKSFPNVIKYVLKKYSDVVGIQAISDNNEYYVLNETKLMKAVITKHFDSGINININQLPLNICKVLFLINEDAFDEVADDILSMNFKGIELVKSGGACFEMMAEGITKGNPLPMLAQFYDKTIENVVAIGDYYNDIEMLKTASFSAAVDNAPQEIKNVANITVKSCDEDGLADFINILIKKYNNKF